MRKPKGDDLIALILSIAGVVLSLISMVLHEIVEKVQERRLNAASASVPSSASQYLHLNQNHNTCIDLSADTESELDAAAALTIDKRVDIVRSIRCNTLSAAICYRCNGRRRSR